MNFGGTSACPAHSFVEIVEELRPSLPVWSYKRNRAPVQAEEKVAAYLMRLSSAASYRHLGAVFDMSETHVRICCRQVGTALLTRYATEVRLPTHDEAVLSGVEFAHRYGIHGCIGAVDGTHIPFRCPVGVKEAHWCHKSFHSFHLHAMVDNNFLLWDCHVGWPGSCGDSTVWGSRPFNQGPLGLLEGDPAITRGGFLLPHHFLMGDGGYTVSTSVMTPFSKKKCADSLERAYFNYQQSKARRCVEQTFGIMKKMWIVMTVPTESSKESKVRDVWACCILHNMYLRYTQRVCVLANPTFAAERREFEALKESVLIEILKEEEAAAASQAQAAAPAAPKARGISEGALKTAGVALREALCSRLWASRS